MTATFAFSKLVVNDLERSRRFYADAYGLKEYETIRDEIGTDSIEEVVLTAGDTSGPWPSDGLVLLKFANGPGVAPGAMILGFTTEDLPALLARIIAQGGSVHAGIREIPERRLRVAFARDPEGHLAEIVEPMGR